MNYPNNNYNQNLPTVKNADPNAPTMLGMKASSAGALSYINICMPIGIIVGIILAVAEKNSKFARFHAFQSLLAVPAMFLFAFFAGIAIAALGFVLSSSIVDILLYGMVFTVFIGFSVLMAFQAFRGKMTKIPVIGNLADKWSD